MADTSTPKESRLTADLERQAADLRAAERRYRSLVERLPAIVYIDAVEPVGKPIYVSPQVSTILGFEPEEWIADPDLWVRQIHPLDRDRVNDETIRDGVPPDVPVRTEYRMLARDGGVVWFRDDSVLVAADGDTPAFVHGVMTDITDSRAMETERDRLISAVDQTADGVLITDLDSRILYANAALSQLYGFAPGALVGQPATVLRGDQPGPPDTEIWAAIQTDGVWTGSFQGPGPDGTIRTVLSVISMQRDPVGNPIGFVAISRDITRERALEDELRQAQKMESIGLLAGGVAHDFNNLLTVIAGNAQILATELVDHPGRPYAEDIVDAADRGANVTRQLLAFSRKQTLAPEVIDMGSVVENLGPLLRRIVGEDVDLVVRSDGAIHRALVDRSQLEQVVMNLVVNARDAMPTGGVLTIATARVERDDEYARTHRDAAAGTFVELSVTDSGVGMDAATLARAFDPFFTTKELGRGTGLGLSTVDGIVRQSGGHVTLTSTPERGTTCAIYLPASVVEAESAPAGAVASVGLTGHETILVVEDESAVRALVQRILVDAGYEVLVADGPVTAAAIITEHAGRIELLLSDVIMPGGTGPEVAGRLRDANPRAKILFMSGYMAESITDHGVPGGEFSVIDKPFSRDTMLAAVRRALTSDRST